MVAQMPRAPIGAPIHLTESDFEILSALVDAAPATMPGAALLAEELQRAKIVTDRRASPSLVRLGSVVAYEDVASGQVRSLQIGLPKEASIDDNRISVLTPVGAALIGLAVGQVFQWTAPDGRLRKVKVVSVDNSAAAPKAKA